MVVAKFVHNIKYWRFVSIVVSFLIISNSNARADANTTVIQNVNNEVSKVKTKYVKIEGFSKYMPLSNIEDALDVRSRLFLEFWKDDNSYINDRLIPSLTTTLKSFYESEGFYDAKFNIVDGEKEVKISIDEGEPVTIKGVNIVSDFNVADIIVDRTGHIFKSAKFVEDKQKIISKLLVDGYCSYDLDTKAYVDLDKHIVDLVYKIKKGDVCTFGDTTITGNDDIKDSVILSRVEALKGQRFSTKRARDTYQRLEDLESFDTILVNIDRKIYNVVPVDLSLKLVENPYYFSGGLGYDSYTGARIQAQLTKRNFLGDAQKLALTTRYSTKDKLADIDFFRPALFSYDKYYLDFGINGGYSNLEFEGFTEEKEYVKAFTAYEFNDMYLRAGIALENIVISSFGGAGIQDGSFVLLYPYFQATYDTRDDKLNPKYGYYLAGNFEYGIPYNPDASDYTKFLLEARGIYTWHNYTFATVAKIGSIEEITNRLPESKLFFGGGSFGNRAYGYNQLGTILTPTVYTIDGALSFANLSFEVNRPINDEFIAAVFTDNTMLNQRNYDFTGAIVSSAGVGIRYLTPVGPFKIDIGVNVRDVSQFGIQFQLGQSF